MRPRVALLVLLASLTVLLSSVRWVPVTEQVAFAARATKTVREKSPKLKPPAPVPPAVLAASMQRGIDYLVKNQNKDGSWGGPSWRGGVLALEDIPGNIRSFTAAVTALCVEALIEAGCNTPEVEGAIKRGEIWLLDHLREVRQDTPSILYNIWTHAYGIQALAAMHGRLPDNHERRRTIEKLIHQQIDRLKRCETMAGGWFYYNFNFGPPGERPWETPSSFVNATVLVALDRAKRQGIDSPRRVVNRAIKSTVKQRKPDGSYNYVATRTGNPDPDWVMQEINQLPGGLGRVQACNAALRQWGDEHITDDVLKTWLDRLIARNGWLDLGRKKPIPHESFAKVAGYFYYYGHYYAGLCLSQLPAQEQPLYQDHLARIIMDRQEADGSWFDFPLYSYHKPYGTAFALMTLQACRKPAASPTARPPEKAGAAPAPDGVVKKELVGMAGDWRMVRGEHDGKPASERFVENFQCVIDGDQLTFKGVEPLTEKASKLHIQIDTSTTPKCIDLKVEAGSLKGDVLEGVYERKGDELKLCLSLSKGNRPVDFETKDGSNRLLFVLKREKP